LRMRGVTLSDKSFSIVVVEVVIRENQIVATRRKGAPCRNKTENDRDAMRSQELTRGLLGEDRVVFRVENVHGARSGPKAQRRRPRGADWNSSAMHQRNVRPRSSCL